MQEVPFTGLTPLAGQDGVHHFSLPAAEAAGAGPISRLPYSLRVLVEHLLRQGFDDVGTAAHVQAVTRRTSAADTVPFLPRRIMMQDASGLPVLADLAALADAVRERGGDPDRALPRLPMDLVVDHAIEVDYWGRPDAAERNLAREMERHRDRYRFLRWAQTRLPTLRVAPPGSGICHQLNLEVLADVVTVTEAADGRRIAGFDSVLGTDSHTTMINALAVFGWGVGGIEATAAALGRPIVMKVPEVVAVRLTGTKSPGVLATDVALTLTSILRAHGVVHKIVEFTGPALAHLTVPDRATVANMAPEYGATMAFFPPDAQTLAYLRATGRPNDHVDVVEAFLRAQQMLWSTNAPEPEFSSVIEVDLGEVRPTIAGPKRPDQRRTLPELPLSAELPAAPASRHGRTEPTHGDVVVAAITSCTNTSNPRALVAAGLLARNALSLGLSVPPWTKTSFAPGSPAASRLLESAGLQDALDQLGFHLVGHGCTTCMGNSGPLPPTVEEAIRAENLQVAAVLSGNRNFEGRIHPHVPLAYLASPPLVVALALSGTVAIDLVTEPIGEDRHGRPVSLGDIWPTEADIDHALDAATGTAQKLARSSFPASSDQWDRLEHPKTRDYDWDPEPGFIRRPPFLGAELARPGLDGDIREARPLMILGDMVTTDHISPVSRIGPAGEAGRWLLERGVPRESLAGFSAWRLNHDVMIRGGFANPRLRNLMVPGVEGGVTRLMPDDVIMPVHEAATHYLARGVPLVIVAGDGYGAGSARDWAAKVTRLLGARAVIARGFERIHRTNLVAMGVLPLRVADDLALKGDETLDILGVEDALVPGGTVTIRVFRDGRFVREAVADGQIETATETRWLRHGGLLPEIMAEASPPRLGAATSTARLTPPAT
ncbi:aconitate hydratase AcnA [Actinomadura sp. NAK00032]|nr:aconitate hydratase AcnA [Actinomadura sp. NAK00032]QKW35647.1 aconitate hydratase AcnA [Actinomadura sp. NAK00032]